MKRTHARILIMAVLAVAGCNFVSEADEPVTSGDADSNLATDKPCLMDEQVVILDEEETVDGRPADAAMVDVARLQGGGLALMVSWSGGCRAHGFKLLAGQHFAETSPPSAAVWLSHKANGDPCEAVGTAGLMFDLAPLREVFETQYPDEEAFRVVVHQPTGGGFERVEADLLLYEW